MNVVTLRGRNSRHAQRRGTRDISTKFPPPSVEPCAFSIASSLTVQSLLPAHRRLHLTLSTWRKLRRRPVSCPQPLSPTCASLPRECTTQDTPYTNENIQKPIVVSSSIRTASETNILKPTHVSHLAIHRLTDLLQDWSLSNPDTLTK